MQAFIPPYEGLGGSGFGLGPRCISSGGGRLGCGVGCGVGFWGRAS